MAIVAISERNLFLEIAIEVTSKTSNLDMLPEERILCLGMVEIKTGQHGLPATGGVTSFARLLEFAFVWVDMARRASIKLHVPVARRATGSVGLVALFTGHLDVETSKWITRLGMIEILCGFPAFHVMAFGALVPELAFVRVSVAALAIACKPEIRFGGILSFDEGPIGRGHMRGCMTLLARYGSVFSFEIVARQAVIELFLRRLPAN